MLKQGGGSREHVIRRRREGNPRAGRLCSLEVRRDRPDEICSVGLRDIEHPSERDLSRHHRYPMMDRFSGGTDEGRARVIAQEPVGGREARRDCVCCLVALLRRGRIHGGTPWSWMAVRPLDVHPSMSAVMSTFVTAGHPPLRLAVPRPVRVTSGTRDGNFPSAKIKIRRITTGLGGCRVGARKRGRVR